MRTNYIVILMRKTSKNNSSALPQNVYYSPMRKTSTNNCFHHAEN